MSTKLLFSILAITITLTLSACNAPATPATLPSPEPVENPPLPQASPPSALRIPGLGGSTEWPAYIPSEIPPLNGTITNVMEAAGSHVRLFYEGITKEQLEQYLSQLESLGYSLEYIVYVPEGFPDNSEERLKQGDYDAVRITRGEYQMNIEYGEEILTYDISTAAFAQSIPAAPKTNWPAGLAGLVPQPARCSLDNNILPDSTDWFMLTCRPEDSSVLDEYRQALEAAGFQPAASSDPQSSAYVLGDLQIKLSQTTSEIISIEIKRVDSPRAVWPEALSGIIPAPENCPLNAVIQPGGTDFIISCASQSSEVVTNYLALLAANGFVETSRMELEAGNPVSITLEKAPLQVRLMIATTGELSIMVTQKP